ncbi:response regulator transcription factor [Bordetella sp. N]|uniref:response regulator n=1 Tax=Bordetella sp. N TaxID=1746199 RepID=UPI000AF8419C|nr:response regulator transcription factor [Bordetella sp. N]
MQNAGSVLIVDDHPMIRFAVKTLFEQNGWKVVAEAGSGVDALSAARQYQPDLIVLDIGIPRMDGLMVISRLRGDDEQRAPRIVVLSAQTPSTLQRVACMRARRASSTRARS